jgi:hypothetical protein
VKRKEIEGKVFLCLEFESPARMMEYIAWNHDNATAYLFDGLDACKIGNGNTFVLKRCGDRPKEFEVKIENRDETTFYIGS